MRPLPPVFTRKSECRRTKNGMNWKIIVAKLRNLWYFRKQEMISISILSFGRFMPEKGRYQWK